MSFHFANHDYGEKYRRIPKKVEDIELENSPRLKVLSRDKVSISEYVSPKSMHCTSWKRNPNIPVPSVWGTFERSKGNKKVHFKVQDLDPKQEDECIEILTEQYLKEEHILSRLREFVIFHSFHSFLRKEIPKNHFRFTR